MYKYKLKRRSFIKSSTLAATGLIIGFTYDPKKSLAAKTKIRMNSVFGYEFLPMIQLL